MVLRATRRPCCASSRASSASESGARGSSAAISSFMTARTAVAEAAPPFSVARRREKKCLNSNRPRGVAMYLLLVTRQTVDSCRPSSPAISFSVSGFIATSPYSKQPPWGATMEAAPQLARFLELARERLVRAAPPLDRVRVDAVQPHARQRRRVDHRDPAI